MLTPQEYIWPEHTCLAASIFEAKRDSSDAGAMTSWVTAVSTHQCCAEAQYFKLTEAVELQYELGLYSRHFPHLHRWKTGCKVCLQRWLRRVATLLLQVPVGGDPGVLHAHVAGNSGRHLLCPQLARLQTRLCALLQVTNHVQPLSSSSCCSKHRFRV